jgi:hypothetical protein
MFLFCFLSLNVSVLTFYNYIISVHAYTQCEISLQYTQCEINLQEHTMRNKLTVFLFYGKHDLYTIGDEILTILAQIDHFLCYICIFIQKQLHKHYSDAFQQIIFTKIVFYTI